MEKTGTRWLWLAAATLATVVVLAIIVESRRRAEVQQAAADAVDLHEAVERYYSEYNILPDTGAADFTTDSPAGRKLLSALIGDNRHGESVRAVCLLRSSREDLALSASNRVARGFTDPWGNPYRVILDDDYDRRITVDAGDDQLRDYRGPALIVSRGRDGIAGTKDDIRSQVGSPKAAPSPSENRR